MNKKDGRIHLKLYITMVFCVVMSVLITSTILYVNFQSILMKHEYNSKLSKMESEAARITKLSNISLNTLFQIYNDISVKKLLRYDDIDATEESAAFIQLRYYLTTVPNVDSIYVYNVGNNRIYNVTNESELVKPWRADYDKNDQDFFDRSAIEMINHCSDYLPFVPVPRYYQVNEQYSKCVYTYMMYNTFNNTNRSDVVMLNLDSQYLFQEDRDDLNSISLVVDQKDRIVYSNSDRFPVTKQLTHDFDPNKNIEKKESGYFVTNVGGVQSVVIFTGEDKHHWRYISIIDYDVLLSQVNKMQTICIIITALIALIGGVIAHVFSRRLSIPIKTLSMDVLHLQNENRKLELQSRNRKVMELLANNGQDSKGNYLSGTDLLSFLGMNITKETKMYLLYLQVDRYKALPDPVSTSDLQAYKFAAFNILEELLTEKAKTCHVDLENDKSILFIVGDSPISKEYMETIIKQMQQRIKEYFSLSISVIVADKGEEPDDLYLVYDRMRGISSRSLFFGEAYLVFLSDIEDNLEYHYEYPEQKEKQLMEQLMLGKASEAKRIYDEIISHTYQFPIIIYNMVVNRLIFALDNVVNVLKKNGAENSFTGFFILTNLIQESDTLEIRNEKFYELFDRIQLELEKRKGDKQEQVVERINHLIEKGFEDPDFSLDYLGDAIGMSTAYMCRLYKQYTGKTIIDVLADFRMNRARELLKNTDFSVNEIAEKVGYSNSTYFYRVFKKENGVTPNEYRRK